MPLFCRVVVSFVFCLFLVGNSGCAKKGSEYEATDDQEVLEPGTDTDAGTDGTPEEDTQIEPDTSAGDPEVIVPADTETPVDTDTPEDTEVPADTETPVDADTPEDTEVPTDTETSVDADTPDDTEAPEDVNIPEDTPIQGKYKGLWPENPNLDQMVDPGWEGTPGVGKTLPHYIAMDQHGDMVDLYDFAGTGKLVVLDVGTWYCKPCKGMASYFSTGDPSSMDDYPWWNESYEIVKDLIDNKDIYWITVLYSLGTPVYDDVLKWEEAFPSKDIPVLADGDLQLKEYLQVKAMPHIAILDSDMKFLLWTVQGPTAGMKYLVEFAKGL